MKTAFMNAKVYVEEGHFEEAILIEKERILKVGSNEEVKELLEDGEVYDCEGKTIIPGLNDSHMHVTLVGEMMSHVDITGCDSIQSLIDTCKEFIEENPDKVKEGIHSVGWNQDLFKDEKRYPTRHDLDQISREIPIVLERVCGHVVSGNSKAIEKTGLTAESEPIEGGTFEVEDGELTGVFTENAVFIINNTVPKESLEAYEDMVIKAMDRMKELGLTTVQSNDVKTGPLPEKQTYDLFERLYKEGKLDIRFRHQVRYDSVEELQGFLDTYYKEKEKHPLLSIGPLKLFKDGSLGGRTGTMREGYADDPGNFGVESLSDELQDDMVKLASEHGLQVITHVIGDKAIEDTVRSYKKFMTGKNEERHGLVHCQITDRPLLEAIAENNIFVFAQPIFLDYDMKVVEERVGKELASTSYAFKSLKDLGAHVSYGTDAPVEDVNPFECIYMAVTRKDREGNPSEGFYPEERVSVSEAIDAYTIESAYAMFKEDELGRLKEGYLADLVVLDEDIFSVEPDRIKEVRPVLTMCHGKVIYKR